MTHILLLESNEVLARIYAQALQYRGYSTMLASSAEMAIAAADQVPPELVILELQLAGHDGIEFLHEFRSYPEWQYAPVIINTQITPAIITPSLSILRQELGVTAYLYKPHTSLRQLLRVVREQTVGL